MSGIKTLGITTNIYHPRQNIPVAVISPM